MKLIKLSIVCLLAAAAVAVCVSGAPSTEDENVAGVSTDQAVRADFSPSKLFDFANFKKVFKKTYSGMVEELVRAKYYLSRAFRALISAIKYKYRKSRFYLAVNEMSDWTPQEVDKSENKLLAEANLEAIKETVGVRKVEAQLDDDEDTHNSDNLPDVLLDNVDDVQRELKKMAASVKPGEPGFDELNSVTNGASLGRSSTDSQSANVRDLPMDKLIDTGADVRLNAQTAQKLTSFVESNNPNYEPLELHSFGLADEQENVTYWELTVPGPNPLIDAASFVASALSNTLKSIKFGSFAEAEDEPVATKAQLPDEVFLDLRLTNCFTMPRQQGHCGSCYAFAAITLFEWMYCMKTGKLVQFSEQYVVDCGKEYVDKIDGCDGGHGFAMGHFVSNFGLELRSKYPYNMRENQCPYDPSTNPKSTGFIRFDYQHAVEIPLELAPKHLKNGPLWIAVSTGPAFREYGGGVFGHGCPKKATHAIVLLGHGREDGEEYWLVRNSHSVGWGEGGYGKLAKNADCIKPRAGWRYGSDNGEYKVDIKENKLNDQQVVKTRYLQKMLLD